ncbi:MAG: GNAT family N-acetyltransferase [Deltaproteobacteria bacterium]|nr:GNAT family N-acetyltransferase [Deltaproteobacteria bacterium]
MQITDHIKKDGWLSGLIGKDSFQFIVDESLQNHGEDFVQNFHSQFTMEKFFVYSKIGTNRLLDSSLLEETGFRLIDTNVRLNKFSKIQVRQELHPDFEIRFTKQGDKKEVVRLAQKNFRFSRFHLDPSINNNIADNIKGKWVENYYKGERGDHMVVALSGGQIVGFAQLIKKKSLLIIDLIAVDSSYRGKGIASSMIAFAESQINCTETLVGTQVSNIPSMRLYESLGFKTDSSDYVFHFHR